MTPAVGRQRVKVMSERAKVMSVFPVESLPQVSYFTILNPFVMRVMSVMSVF